MGRVGPARSPGDVPLPSRGAGSVLRCVSLAVRALPVVSAVLSYKYCKLLYI